MYLERTPSIDLPLGYGSVTVSVRMPLIIMQLSKHSPYVRKFGLYKERGLWEWILVHGSAVRVAVKDKVAAHQS